MVTVKRTDSNNPDFRKLVLLLDKDLRDRYGVMQDNYAPFNHINNLDTVVVASFNEVPVGCACFKKHDENSVELKRMFVDKEYRGKGLGAAILAEMEAWAGELNYSAMVLETAIRQPEAIGLYKTRGFEPIPNYGQYIDMTESICMKKTLSKKETVASQH